MKRFKFVALLGVAIVAIHARASLAQEVPALALEITAGAGRHTLITSNAYYYDDNAGILRFAAIVRLGTAGALRPVLMLEHSPNFISGESLVCGITPSGGCYNSFPEPKGTALAIGVAGAAGSRLVGTVAAGLAEYDEFASFVDANVALRLFRHVSVVVDGRYIRSTDGVGNRTWHAPLSAGLRFH